MRCSRCQVIVDRHNKKVAKEGGNEVYNKMLKRWEEMDLCVKENRFATHSNCNAVS